MPYQDTWIRGSVTETGERECEARYDLIRRVAEEYTRPISVLDLGANLGYFGCRLADELGTVSVMVDNRPELVGVCKENSIPTTIAMMRKLSVRDLEELAASEHFDIVLVLNLLHHFKDWRSALKAVLSLGEQIIIETPSRDDRGACRSHVSGHILDVLEDGKPELLGYAESHVTPGVRRPIYRFRYVKPSLKASYAYRDRLWGKSRIRSNRIESATQSKRIVFADGESRDWVAGMNLWNWCQMGGSYPSKSTVIDAVSSTVSSYHGDLRPWNFILQGENCVPIDTMHRSSHTGKKALKETIGWIKKPKTAYLR